MADPFYTRTLYPFQNDVLRVITNLDTGFYLTGGTAASRGYLHHRYSDDLDFFVNDEPDFSLWVERVIQALNAVKGWRQKIIARHDRIVRVNIIRPDLVLKLEFINDVPSRAGEETLHPVLGKLDSAENILANKLSALMAREEPKDLADVWGFCCQMKLSLEHAITDAQSKAAGIFPADLSRILLSTTQEDYGVIRWIEPPPVDEFIRDLRYLGESLIL